jgi:hypothetical protein
MLCLLWGYLATEMAFCSVLLALQHTSGFSSGSLSWSCCAKLPS